MKITTIDPILNETHAIFYLDGKLHYFSELEEGFLFSNKYRINLLTKEKTIVSRDEILSFFYEHSLTKKYENAHVLVLHYELGAFLKNVNESTCETTLFYLLKFKKTQILPEIENIMDETIEFTATLEVSENEYRSKFDKVMNHLESGNCYQLNLTCMHEYKFNVSIQTLYQKFLSSKKLSQFAHSIFIKEESYFLISNSPECLFEYSDGVLTTRPIKGTMSQEAKAEDLLNDLKNNTELNIVTDLLRNDLSSIGDSFSYVDKHKHLFSVPGLNHLCSIIKVKIDVSKISLLNILVAMFPGGSISGAPKKRVMELISEVEECQRGFYTGSSILFYNDIKRASINIRTAKIEIESSKLSYAAGGGITLLSESKNEYLEMKQKIQSFLSIF